MQPAAAATTITVATNRTQPQFISRGAARWSGTTVAPHLSSIVTAMSKPQPANGLTHRHNAIQSTPTRTIPPTSTPTLHDSTSIWSPNPERARAEQFFLLWSVCWVGLMAYIVYTRWFETFTPNHYLTVGLTLFLVPTLIPVALPDLFLSSHLPLSRRYTTKANCYIFILAWIANYLWTHYFYAVLHATYTFQAHRLNDVPFALYLITHSYFHLYHVLSSILLRVTLPRAGCGGWRWWRCWCSRTSPRSWRRSPSSTSRTTTYPTATPCTWWGSVFYGLYFVASYPMFYQLDERANRLVAVAHRGGGHGL